MGLTQIKHAARLLSLGQLSKICVWLHELIRRAEDSDRTERPPSRKGTLAERTLDNKTYRLESIRCGKENCKCMRGKLHGPYWYSYTRVGNKVTSQYIGKRIPKALEKKIGSRSE